jgi:toxin FitB
MIVLDTNVLSALMQQHPDAQVVAWLDQQHAESIWISSITLFEARYGLALLAPGQRKSLLQERFDQLVQDDLENRVLQFDADAATQAARLAAERKTRGRPVDIRDTFIAGIALAKRATLATRNTRHFDDLSVRVVNPWQRVSDSAPSSKTKASDK